MIKWRKYPNISPPEAINPVTRDYQKYLVTIRTNGSKDVCTLSYGSGHFWYKNQPIDSKVIAWAYLPEPYEQAV